MQSAPVKPTLFTIGHSDHQLAEFFSLLNQHGIDTIADVRSQPYSRFHAQFNRETLAVALKRVGVGYAFLGRELGARRSEPESYRNGQARYDLIQQLPAFQAGLDWIRERAGSQRIALLCAEKDPLTCHRTILVCRHLRPASLAIAHVLEDGTVETTEQAESRLLDLVGLPPAHLFCSKTDLIEQAYDLQAERIAFRESEAITGMREGVA
jgi:uncharacterized protein (DUF488 family)